MNLKDALDFAIYVISVFACSTLFIKGGWKRSTSYVTGFFMTTLCYVLHLLAKPDLPGELKSGMIFLAFLLGAIILLILMDHTYSPPPHAEADVSSMLFGLDWEEEWELDEEVELIDCPFCGLEVEINRITCSHCGKNLVRDESEKEEDPYLKRLEVDWVMDEAGYAPNPDPVSVDDADHRATIWVIINLLLMVSIAIFAYFASR